MQPVASTIKAFRYVKALLVATVGGFAALVVFGNITDYDSNFQFVKHVLAMDSRRADLGKTIEYRAIEWEWAWHAAYIGVILVEIFIMAACLYGAYRMARVADRKSTRLNSSHVAISYAVFCLKKKNRNNQRNCTTTT